VAAAAKELETARAWVPLQLQAAVEGWALAWALQAWARVLVGASACVCRRRRGSGVNGEGAPPRRGCGSPAAAA
jgi:hypothetical protein